jgi:glycine/D-amino acid oxidase-like deaminating enzyme
VDADGGSSSGGVTSPRAIERVGGTLWLFRDEENFAVGRDKARAARAAGFAKCRVVDAVEGPKEFPFLKYWKRAPATEAVAAAASSSDSTGGGDTLFPGAVYAGDDHSADARTFTLKVVSAAQSLGVEFQYGLDVSRLSFSEARSTHDEKAGAAAGGAVTCTGVVMSSGEVLRADAVVLACASHSTKLAPSGPVRMPIEPLRGFSIDLLGVTHAEDGNNTSNSDRNDTAVPQTAFADYSSGDLNYQYTPFLEKGRARIVGFADFVGAGYADDAKALAEDTARATRMLVEHTRYVMPGLAWRSQTPTWFGLRPMTPDNMVSTLVV